MNNETNMEQDKVFLTEQPVENEQESSKENQTIIDQTIPEKEREIPKEYQEVEPKHSDIESGDFDPTVYYANREAKINQQERQQTFGEDRNIYEGSRPSLFGPNIRSMRLPKITSKEEARKVFYGQSVAYYERYYNKLKETKKKISWNWAAFFLNVYWFFSRKMYAYGLLVMVWKAMFTLVGYNLYDNMTDARMRSLMVPWALMYILVDVVIGMFANYLYISHMESKIEYPGESDLSGDDLAKVIIIRGGFTLTGALMCFFLSDLVLYGLQYLMTIL